MLLVEDVVSGPNGDQVGVVSGGGNGDASGATGVGVAQLVGQGLELVSGEAVIIPETAVVAGPRGALDALVWAQVEVVLRGVSDVGVHCGPGGDIARPPRLVSSIWAEEPGVVPLLDDDEGYAGPEQDALNPLFSFKKEIWV